MSDSTPLSTRVIDAEASSGAKHALRANSSASVSTTVSNASARGALSAREKIKNIKGKAGGLFSKLRGRKDTADDEPAAAEPEGAFNAANHEYEPNLFGNIRDGWVRRHMLARESAFTSHEPVALSVLTWNVGAKKPPPPEALDALLGPLAAECSILAIGLQEAVELSAANVGAGAAGPLAGGSARGARCPSSGGRRPAGNRPGGWRGRRKRRSRRVCPPPPPPPPLAWSAPPLQW